MEREKIIKGLEYCLTLDSPCGDCPYYSYEDIQELDCERNLRHDALFLLKEQEAVKPIWSIGKPFCGACGLRIHGGKFCSKCGKPILWEGR